MKRILSLSLLAVLLIATSVVGGKKRYEDMTLEELLNIEVVTASKHLQRMNQSPSTITVITEEKIHQSGATNIPDILRMVPGLDIMEVTASDKEVSARGFNKLMSNKMLVLIDGRSVYWDFYGMTMWETLPVALEEIKRIEVIRGPGSSLYGANAFCGVINIITKSPKEMEGTYISTTMGNFGTYATSLIKAGVVDRFGYKVSLSWDRVRRWRDTENSKDLGKFNAILDYKLGRASKLALSGGMSDGKVEIFGAGQEGIMDLKGRRGYLQIDYTRPHLQVRSFWNGAKVKAVPQDEATDTWPTTVFCNTYDLELQHSFNLGERNSLIWGGSFRLNRFDWELLDKGYHQWLWSGFLQDEFEPIRSFTLLLGGRYDYHPLVKSHLTPRTGVVWSPLKNQTFRFSFSTAFRNPTFLESYWKLDMPLGGGEVMEMYGNPDLKPEKIISYELGWLGLFSKGVSGRLNLFYNRLGDFIHSQTITTFPSPPAPYPGIPSGISFVNSGKAKSRGGEVGLNLWLREWLKGWANYSYQGITDEESNKRIRTAPQAKINLGLNFKFKNGFSANFLAHYVGETEWEVKTGMGARDLRRVRPYTLLNAKLGYRFWGERFEIAGAAFNLFNRKHREYPLGDEIGRRVVAELNLNL